MSEPSALFDDSDDDEWIGAGARADATTLTTRLSDPALVVGRRPGVKANVNLEAVSSAPSATEPASAVDATSQITSGRSPSPGIEVGTSDPTAFQQILRTHTTCKAVKLGVGNVDAPASKAEVLRLINKCVEDQNSDQGLADKEENEDGGNESKSNDVLVCIPRLRGGYIYIVNGYNYQILERHRIKKILFCAKGAGLGEYCIGFTNHVHLNGDRERSDSTISHSTLTSTTTDSDAGTNTSSPTEGFLCHIFQFPGEAKTEFAIQSIAQAFGSGGGKSTKDDNNDLLYTFDAVMWISEADAGKEDGTPCQYSNTKSIFKLHPTDEPRLISVQLTQTSKQQKLIFEQGFGLMLGTGKSDGDMSSVEMSSCEKVSDNSLRIVGKWDPPESLQRETLKDSPNLGFVIGIDVVLAKVSEPLRLQLRFQVRVSHTKERFVHISFKSKAQKGYSRSFKMKLKSDDSVAKDAPSKYVLDYVEEQKVLQRDSYMQKMKQLARLAKEPEFADAVEEDIDEDVDTESMNHPLSGMGKVTREMSENIIEMWADVLSKWDTVPHSKIRSLARKGIPDVLRHQVWKRLVTFKSSGLGDEDLLNAFPHLVKKESETEKVIKWDLTRTFPGNEFFAEEGGEGQMRLFRVCKAYSVYDEEIGYCQGLSFIVAVLLLHMPDEDAFTLFIKIMYNYGVRDMFKAGFSDLQLKFYQLAKLIEEMIPDLHAHFKEEGIETHMFASQWFLTMFAAKFPLVTAYRVVDVLLSEGIMVLYQISLGLLKLAKEDILQQDFEGILQFFRVALPRRFQDEASAGRLISASLKLKVTDKKLKKLEMDYLEMKAAEAESQDPLTRLEDENKRLQAQVMRLEAENEMLANEMGTSQITAHEQLEEMDAKLSQSNREILRLKELLNHTTKDAEEDKQRLEHEAAQIKGMYRTTVEDSEKQQKVANVARRKAEKELATALQQFEKEKAELQQLANVGQAKAALAEMDVDKVELQKQVHDREMKLAEALGKIAELGMTVQGLEQQLIAAKSDLEQELAKKGGKWFKR